MAIIDSFAVTYSIFQSKRYKKFLKKLLSIIPNVEREVAEVLFEWNLYSPKIDVYSINHETDYYIFNLPIWFVDANLIPTEFTNSKQIIDNIKRKIDLNVKDLLEELNPDLLLNLCNPDTIDAYILGINENDESFQNEVHKYGIYLDLLEYKTFLEYVFTHDIPFDIFAHTSEYNRRDVVQYSLVFYEEYNTNEVGHFVFFVNLNTSYFNNFVKTPDIFNQLDLKDRYNLLQHDLQLKIQKLESKFDEKYSYHIFDIFDILLAMESFQYNEYIPYYTLFKENNTSYLTVKCLLKYERDYVFFNILYDVLKYVYKDLMVDISLNSSYQMQLIFDVSGMIKSEGKVG